MASNESVADLAAAAKEQCEGCRLSWRLHMRNGVRDWHQEPMPMICKAYNIRLQLRNIASYPENVR